LERRLLYSVIISH